MKAESNLRPAQVEIEALPPISGRKCTIILCDNIAGPFQRPDGDPYYTFDRYTLDDVYRDGIAEAVTASFTAYLAKAKEAENPTTEVDILKNRVAALQEENKSLSTAVDDLTVAILMGGGGNV